MPSTLTCADCGTPMQQNPKSRPQGEARCHPCRRARPARKPPAARPRPPDKTMHCADCGGSMWRGATSRPEGQARCLPCRRANPAVPQKKRAPQRTCKGCNALLPVGSPRRYCTSECGRRRACEVCGTDFYPHGEQRTCSRACGVKLKNPTPKVRTLYIRWCAQCGAVFLGRARRTCSDACARQDYNLTRRKTPPVAPCRNCGEGSVPYPAKHCEACRRELLLEASRRGRRRRRARQRGVKAEPYTLAEIAKRDHNRCGLCRKRVAMTQAVPHPKAPTIDHMLPLACGGDDTRANVQLACFLCNSIKGDRGGNEQLALVG